jgi:hypothetical protein
MVVAYVICHLFKEVITAMTKRTLLILSSALILFTLFIRLQNPGQSISVEATSAAVAADNAISDQSSEKAVIGQIQTRDKVIIIRSGADGQLYTIKSKDGNLLAADLNAGELNARFPELKEVIQNGLAGDASLRVKNVLDYKNPAITIKDVNK